MSPSPRPDADCGVNLAQKLLDIAESAAENVASLCTITNFRSTPRIPGITSVGTNWPLFFS
jgi:hypothetical protein